MRKYCLSNEAGARDTEGLKKNSPSSHLESVDDIEKWTKVMRENILEMPIFERQVKENHSEKMIFKQNINAVNLGAKHAMQKD